MKRSLLTGLCACLLLAGGAYAQIDALTSFAAPIGGPGWLGSCPAGDGQPLTGTGMIGIMVRVIDVTGAPVLGLGPDDFEVDGLVPFLVCDAFFPGLPRWDVMPGGFNVAGPGLYRIDGPLLAGGHEPGQAIVKVRGVRLLGQPPLPLRMVSPDLDGNGAVNLADISIFAGAYFGPYDWRADFNGDGSINLADIPILASHLGHALPAVAIPDPVD